jgi:tetratricopeptide (TPR) repeat protein
MDVAREQRINALKEFLAGDPEDHFSRYALALEYLEEGQTRIAIDCFEEVLRQNAEILSVYYHLGRALERAGDKERAMIVYESGITLAKQQGKQRTENELKAALSGLREEEEL